MIAHSTWGLKEKVCTRIRVQREPVQCTGEATVSTSTVVIHTRKSEIAKPVHFVNVKVARAQLRGGVPCRRLRVKKRGSWVGVGFHDNDTYTRTWRTVHTGSNTRRTTHDAKQHAMRWFCIHIARNMWCKFVTLWCHSYGIPGSFPLFWSCLRSWI